MTVLPKPPGGRNGVVEWVREHLGHLACDEVHASPICGGQIAADAALAGLDIAGYASQRSVVLPASRRGATRLSPYIRHGLLSLPAVWAAAGAGTGASPRDVQRFRDELLWQEYARHLYARVGGATAEPLRFGPPKVSGGWTGEPWPDEMACMKACTRELHDEGWLVNQTRMWLSSQYSVRAGGDWREGADEMYRHLLDGSPAANRLGWQWTVGTGTGKVYGFSRWQVEKRAPGLCRSCARQKDCPVQNWPVAEAGPAVDPPAGLLGISKDRASVGVGRDPGRAGAGVGAGALAGALVGAGRSSVDGGPSSPQVSGLPEVVWLTGESMGDTDPARIAHPDLPAVFVFDEPLLRRLRLSGKRLVFIAEALAEMDCEVRLGDPVEELQGRRLATTWSYVPGWKRRAPLVDVVALYPWPWLRQPGTSSLRSYSAWVR